MLPANLGRLLAGLDLPQRPENLLLTVPLPWHLPLLLTATLTTDITAIANQRSALLANLTKIDITAAQKKAAADLSLARQTLNTLFTDVNIVSLAPVAVFDVARIGPAQALAGGTRIGPGGGVRLELASYVDFTLGYAANILRGPGEDHGAIFFSMRFRDLFR